jgi:glucose/arabinose dehydrogenase
MRRLLGSIVALLLLVACTDTGPSAVDVTTTSAPSSTTAPGATSSAVPLPGGTLATVSISTVKIGQLNEPIALAARPGSSDLYIAEKGGRVRLIKATVSATTRRTTYQVQSTPLLDLSAKVLNEGERGLLGMAFSSDGRKIYLDYTRQPDGWTVVTEFELGDRTTIDTRSRRDLLLVEQPFANHNGGQVVVGPDGYLYIGLGDGGSRGDPSGNAQDPTKLLGSILRIDPTAALDEDPAYGIPPGNPFANGENGAPEVWLYGVRNPWRFTFDRLTGDLWVGDVGQDLYEEIDRLPSVAGFDAGRGANLGWDKMEGAHSYEGGENPSGAVLPIFEYGRDAGCAVIGGYVYRGDQIPGLAGTYLYADSCGAGLRGLQVYGDTLIDAHTWDLPVQNAYSLGQDDNGEIYVLLASGPVLKLTGG